MRLSAKYVNIEGVGLTFQGDLEDRVNLKGKFSKLWGYPRGEARVCLLTI